jgi:hypothetical protein
MKKILFVAFIIPLFFLSCKKDQSGLKNYSTKKYPVVFNVTNFVQKQGSFALRHSGHTLASSDTVTNLSSYLDVLYYVVLDDHNNPVKEKYQDSTMANMGTITDSLPPGNYTIGIAAGKKGMQATATFGIGSFFDYGNDPWQDTFFTSFPLTVSTAPISQNVTLNRVVGKLEVQITDTIPPTADSLIVSIDGDAVNKGFLDGTQGNHRTTTFHVAIPASAKGQTNVTFDRLVGGTNYGQDLTLTCKGPGNNVIVSRTYSTITVYDNEKTIALVPLFKDVASPQTGQSFTVKIDTAWSSTVNHQSF